MNKAKKQEAYEVLLHWTNKFMRKKAFSNFWAKKKLKYIFHIYSVFNRWISYLYPCSTENRKIFIPFYAKYKFICKWFWFVFSSDQLNKKFNVSYHRDNWLENQIFAFYSIRSHFRICYFLQCIKLKYWKFYSFFNWLVTLF